MISTPTYPSHLSSHFSYLEATHSLTALSHGISNEANEMQLANMLNTARRMEVVRQLLGHPIQINSWLRVSELNRLVGSRDTSDHINGNAVDFTSPLFGTPVQICRLLVHYQDSVGFKQLILEHSWVHISFDPNSTATPKLQVLSLLDSGAYATGLTDSHGKFYT